MIIKKTTLFLIAITFFSVMSLSAKAADCSGYKTFSHKWIKCKGGSLGELGKDGVSVDENKEPGKIGGFFKKIKNFGGKNVGESG